METLRNVLSIQRSHLQILFVQINEDTGPSTYDVQFLGSEKGLKKLEVDPNDNNQWAAKQL